MSNLWCWKQGKSVEDRKAETEQFEQKRFAELAHNPDDEGIRFAAPDNQPSTAKRRIAVEMDLRCPRPCPRLENGILGATFVPRWMW
jgi:hypothetical protein